MQSFVCTFTVTATPKCRVFLDFLIVAHIIINHYLTRTIVCNIIICLIDKPKLNETEHDVFYESRV